jgi:nucleoside-diphosphate-sugar epimerase
MDPASEASPQPPRKETPRKKQSSPSPQRGGLTGLLHEIAENFREARAAVGEVSERVRIEKLTKGAARRGAVFDGTTPTVHQLRKQQGAGKPAMEGEVHQVKAVLKPIQHKAVGADVRSALIVGDPAFLGCALARELHGSGWARVALAGPADADVLASIAPVDFQEFLTPEELSAATQDPAWEACSHVFYLGGWSIEDMPLVKRLFAATMKAGARFVSVSSAASLGPAPGDDPDKRANPATHRPLTASAALSCYFDRAAKAKAPPNAWLSIKTYHLFGSGELVGHGIHGIPTRCLASVRESRPLRLPTALAADASGHTPRFDFLHVQEAARIIRHLAKSTRTEGIYEVGSGRSASAVELAEAAFSALAAPSEITWDPSLPPDEDALMTLFADRSRLSDAGWKEPATDLYASVSEAMRTLVEPETAD